MIFCKQLLLFFFEGAREETSVLPPPSSLFFVIHLKCTFDGKKNNEKWDYRVIFATLCHFEFPKNKNQDPDGRIRRVEL